MANNEQIMREKEEAAKAMVEAGYKPVTVERVQKVQNEWNFEVYVAVVGDAMVVYTPAWKREPVKMICF